MKKLLFIFLTITIFNQLIIAQKKVWNETEQQRIDRMKWWTDARFGMFIHWGISSEAARGEWVQTTEFMTNEEYHKYFEIFDPDLYDPKEWAKAAKYAGMKYVVITSKHHDGFCLWDSDFTDFKSTNTPYGKDLLKPFVEAFREEGLRVGFYYSGPDWNHPKYPVNHGSLIHPLRNRSDINKLNKERDINKYIEYMHNQIRELLTEFGQIDLFWSDYGGDVTTGSPDELLSLVRGLQPGIILNDRLFSPRHLSGLGWKWDYRSPEQTIPSEWIKMEGQKVPWEVCHTLNGSWGYRRNVAITNRYGWKSTKQLLHLIIETVSKGGNILLNVGPTARGKLDEPTLERLKGIGDWMEYHSRSIYECTAAPEGFTAPENCMLTYNPEKRRMYIHILEWPTRLLHLDESFTGKVKYARFLHDASEVQFSQGKAHWDWVWTGDAEIIANRGEYKKLTIELEIEKPNVEIPVIELFLK